MIEDQVYSTWLCTELLNSAQAQVQPRRSWFLRRDMGGTQVSMLFKILHRCLWYTHVQSRITGLDRGTNKYHLGTSLWRRQWQPTPVLLPGKSHGWSSLIGCSPWGREELGMTGRLHFHFSLSCFGEGNGNLLQYSCLENPRDRGAWWAAVYGVAQSRAWLKRFSSSSRDFPYGLVVKNSPANAGDIVSTPGPGRSTCFRATTELELWSLQATATEPWA